MAYMGTSSQIVLNNFSIVGKKFLRIFFRAIEFMLKQRDDFFNLITKNHGLTRTFFSQLRGTGEPVARAGTRPLLKRHVSRLRTPMCLRVSRYRPRRGGKRA
jgi:hypothetical protein